MTSFHRSAPASTTNRSPQTQRDKRLNENITYIAGLTPLRGLAALLVVLFHLNWLDVPLQGAAASADFGNYLLSSSTYFIAKGYIAVDLFFILSGFVLAHVYWALFRERICLQDFSNFLGTRIARIYPLHFVMLILFLLIETAKLVVFSHRPDLFTSPPFSHPDESEAIIYHLTLTQTFYGSGLSWNAPSWSISCEAIVYLIFPFLAIGISRSRWYLLSLALISCAGLALLYSQHGSLNIVGSWAVVRCFFEFNLGIVVYHIVDQKKGARYIQ